MLNDYGKSLFEPLLSVPNIVLGLSVLFVAVLVIAQVDLNSSEWASWVQAIGSITAIWGAFRISNKQVNKQDEERKLLERKSSNSRLSVVRNAAAYAQALGQYVDKDPSPSEFIEMWNGAMSVSVAHAFDSLRALPLLELSSYKQVLLYNEILGAISTIRSAATRFVEAEGDLDSKASEIYTAIKVQAVMIEGHWYDFKLDSDLTSH